MCPIQYISLFCISLLAMWTKTLKSKDIDGTKIKENTESANEEDAEESEGEVEEEEENSDNEYETEED
jgi:hypothetical protein